VHDASSGGDATLIVAEVRQQSADSKLTLWWTTRQVTKEEAAGMAQAARNKARETINSTSRQLGHFEV